METISDKVETLSPKAGKRSSSDFVSSIASKSEEKMENHLRTSSYEDEDGYEEYPDNGYSESLL